MKAGQFFLSRSVGLVEDRVEVERGLLGALPVGLLGGDFVLDGGGNLLEVVGVAGEEEARLDGGEIDFREDGGDLRLERLQPLADLIGGGAILRDVVRLNHDDEAVVAAEILAQFIVVLHRLVLGAEQVAGVVKDVPARHDDEGAGRGEENAQDHDQPGRRAHETGEMAHDALQNPMDDRHKEVKLRRSRKGLATLKR